MAILHALRICMFTAYTTSYCNFGKVLGLWTVQVFVCMYVRGHALTVAATEPIVNTW